MSWAEMRLIARMERTEVTVCRRILNTVEWTEEVGVGSKVGRGVELGL